MVLQSVALETSTGNNISGHYFCNSFFPSFSIFSITTILHRMAALIKNLIHSKLFINLLIDPFSDPVDHFLSPLPAILDFAVGKCI